MDDELKSCPFCGGEASLYSRGTRNGMGYMIYAKCEVCGCSGRAFFTYDDPDETDWNDLACKQATLVWNRRVKVRKSVKHNGE